MDKNKPRIIVPSSIKNISPSEETGAPDAPEKRPVNPWTRFFARYMDYTIYLLIISFIILKLFHKSDFSQLRLTNHQIIILSLLSYMFIILVESILVSTFGTTIGKRFFRLELRNKDGSMLTFSQAMPRSSIVLVIGMGLLIPVFTLIANYVAYLKLVKTGETVWDDSNHVVTHSKFTDNATLVNVGLLIAAFIIINYAWTAYDKYAVKNKIKHCVASYQQRFSIDPRTGIRFVSITYQNDTVAINLRSLTKEMDLNIISKFKADLKDKFIDSMCYDKEMRYVLDNDVSIKIEITNSSGAVLTQINASKYDCK